MKTAMQELIEQFEDIKKTKCKTLQEVVFFDGILAVIDSGGYIEKEKKQIVSAYKEGLTTGCLVMDADAKESANEYYTQTFKP